MTDERIRELQLIELDMLKEVLRIFEKHNIRYFALGGTLLGAVRHEGFIPWDDDIDIGVPRPDYEKLIKLFKEELPDHLKPVYFKNQTDKRPIYWIQVQNQKTSVKQHIANEEIITKVWIDIFPLDAMPTNPVSRKAHSLRLLYWRMRIQLSMFDENVHQNRAGRPFYEKAIIRLYLLTKIGSKSDTYKMMRNLDILLKVYDYEKEDHLINFMGIWKLKEMFPKKIYGEGKLYRFEDIMLMGPSDADYVLTQMYGDYMKPVDPDKQSAHHAIEIVEL